MIVLNLTAAEPELCAADFPFRSDLLEWRACPVCHWPGFRVLQRLEDVQFYGDGTPRVTVQDVQCFRCHTCYKNPVYSAKGFAVLFQHAAASYAVTDPQGRAREQVEWCLKNNLVGDVLDYGCGSGHFLAAWPTRFTRMGIDVDAAQIERAQAAHPALQLQAFPGYGRLTLPARPKIITLWHVLEHIPLPTNQRDCFPLDCLRGSFLTLQREAQGQHPETRLVVEVPILENAWTDDIVGFFTHQHTTHFSRRSLDLMLTSAGWQPYLWEDMPYNGTRVVCKPMGKEQRQLPQPWTEFGEGLHRPPYKLQDGWGIRGGFYHPWQTAGAESDVILAQRILMNHRAAVRKVQTRFSEGIGSAPYVVWGAGMHTEMLYKLTSLNSRLPSVIYDIDPSKQGQTWRGVPILGPRWPLSEPDGTRLLISSYGSQQAIKSDALALGWRPDEIVTLYDDPVSY